MYSVLKEAAYTDIYTSPKWNHRAHQHPVLGWNSGCVVMTCLYYRPEVAMVSVVFGWTCRRAMNESSLFSYWMHIQWIKVLQLKLTRYELNSHKGWDSQMWVENIVRGMKGPEGWSDGCRELNRFHLYHSAWYMKSTHLQVEHTRV